MLEIRHSSDPWAMLFDRACDIIDAAESAAGTAIDWSFGGGTVLMLRLHHRLSKDVDVFLPDPQLLGLFSPRIQDAMPERCTGYVESSGAIKLVYDEGEIDFVVSSSLTPAPFENAHVLGRDIVLETCVEIVAKKFWHRGHVATARDLFDLSAVHDAGVDLSAVAPALRRSGAEFIRQLHERRDLLEVQFEAIDALDYRESYDHCLAVAKSLVAGIA